MADLFEASMPRDMTGAYRCMGLNDM